VPPVNSALTQPCGVLGPGGIFCQHSATWRAGRQMMTAPPQPTNVAKTLNGRHLFAGQLWLHFGHFIAESMSRLWALDHLDAPPGSIIFIPKRPGQATVIKGYQRDFFDLLGITRPIQIIDEATRIEHLIVPGQGFGLGPISKGTANFRAYFANNFAPQIEPKGAAKIYLSRSKLGGLAGGAVLENVLEDNLIAEGYTIYHPQKHSIADQIAQYRAAEKIIGLDGSAFHLFGFVGKPNQEVAVILRRNSNVFNSLKCQIVEFASISPTLVDAVSADWIPQHKNRPGRYSFGQLDFDAVRSQLMSTGFITGAHQWRVPRFREMKRSMEDFGRSKGIDYIRVQKAPPKSAQARARAAAHNPKSQPPNQQPSPKQEHVV
jgi:hypothetical protein